MGFGLIIVGLLLLLGVDTGFGIVGYPLIFIGCKKLYRLKNEFLVSGILALLNMPFAVVAGLTFFGYMPQGNLIYGCLNVSHYVFSAAMFWYFCKGIRSIALGQDESLAASSLRNGIFAVMYYGWTMAVLLIPVLRSSYIVGMIAIFKFVLIGCGVFYLMSCGAKITTPAQMAKENLQMKVIAIKEQEKKEKRK